MGQRRLYCATLRARRTKRLDQRHEIARDRDKMLLVLETVSRPRPRDRHHIPASDCGVETAGQAVMHPSRPPSHGQQWRSQKFSMERV